MTEDLCDMLIEGIIHTISVMFLLNLMCGHSLGMCGKEKPRLHDEFQSGF